MFVLCSTGLPPLTLPGVIPGVTLPPPDFVLPPVAASAFPTVAQDTTFPSPTQQNSTLTKSPVPSSGTTCESINISMTADSS